jgi:hypothetical protein
LEGIVLELADLAQLLIKAPCSGEGTARSPAGRSKPEP